MFLNFEEAAQFTNQEISHRNGDGRLVLKGHNLAALGHGPARQQLAGAEKPGAPLGGDQVPGPHLAPRAEAARQLPCVCIVLLLLSVLRGKHVLPRLYQIRQTRRSFIHTETKMGKSLFPTIAPLDPFMFSAADSECHPSGGKEIPCPKILKRKIPINSVLSSF